MGQHRRVLKQLIGFHPQTAGQLMQRARVRVAGPSLNRLDGSLVQPRRFDELLQRHARAGHKAANIDGKIQHGMATVAERIPAKFAKFRRLTGPNRVKINWP